MSEQAKKELFDIYQDWRNCWGDEWAQMAKVYGFSIEHCKMLVEIGKEIGKSWGKN